MLTKKQKELFVYLNNYISSNDISPSFEEMKNAVNLKSKSGIHRLITSLEQRGYIKLENFPIFRLFLRLI